MFLEWSKYCSKQECVFINTEYEEILSFENAKT